MFHRRAGRGSAAASWSCASACRGTWWRAPCGGRCRGPTGPAAGGIYSQVMGDIHPCMHAHLRVGRVDGHLGLVQVRLQTRELGLDPLDQWEVSIAVTCRLCANQSSPGGCAGSASCSGWTWPSACPRARTCLPACRGAPRAASGGARSAPWLVCDNFDIDVVIYIIRRRHLLVPLVSKGS